MLLVIGCCFFLFLISIVNRAIILGSQCSIRISYETIAKQQQQHNETKQIEQAEWLLFNVEYATICFSRLCLTVALSCVRRHRFLLSRRCSSSVDVITNIKLED
jgi:hypothetical protein